jgi:transcriptional regulator with XRE-family HTH domain
VEEQLLDIHTRLRHLIKVLNHSPTSFSKKLGVNHSQITNVISGRLNKPSVDTLEKIYSVFPRVNIDWLVAGRGEALRPLGAASASNIAQDGGVIQYGNTGTVLGNVTAGTSLSFNSIEDCQRELEGCRAAVLTLQGMVNDKQMIIDLLQKSK